MNREMRYATFKEKLDKSRSSIKSCKICNGEGYLPTGKTKGTSTLFEFEDCECKKSFKEKKNYILANVPKRRMSLLRQQKQPIKVLNTLTNKKVSLYQTIVKRYVKGFKKAKANGLGLMFFGTTGSSKTTAALIILMKLLNKNRDGYYIYFKDLIGLLIQSYDDKSKAPLFKEIINVDLLVIDELSLVSRITPHMIAEFTSVCKQRFEEEKPTILISNYQTADEIFHNFGTPMESLLNEAFVVFKFGGRDLREDKYEDLKKFFE